MLDWNMVYVHNIRVVTDVPRKGSKNAVPGRFSCPTYTGGEVRVTKAELANEVAAAVEGLTKKKAAEVVDAVFHAVQVSLAKGEKIQAVGFGTFEVQQRSARKGRNPQNPKQEINIPAKKVPVFRAGKALKDAVNTSHKKGK
jgi:DNA-binding protein HU-beta